MGTLLSKHPGLVNMVAAADFLDQIKLDKDFSSKALEAAGMTKFAVNAINDNKLVAARIGEKYAGQDVTIDVVISGRSYALGGYIGMRILQLLDQKADATDRLNGVVKKDSSGNPIPPAPVAGSGAAPGVAAGNTPPPSGGPAVVGTKIDPQVEAALKNLDKLTPHELLGDVAVMKDDRVNGVLPGIWSWATGKGYATDLKIGDGYKSWGIDNPPEVKDSDSNPEVANKVVTMTSISGLLRGGYMKTKSGDLFDAGTKILDKNNSGGWGVVFVGQRRLYTDIVDKKDDAKASAQFESFKEDLKSFIQSKDVNDKMPVYLVATKQGRNPVALYPKILYLVRAKVIDYLAKLT